MGIALGAGLEVVKREGRRAAGPPVGGIARGGEAAEDRFRARLLLLSWSIPAIASICICTGNEMRVGCTQSGTAVGTQAWSSSRGKTVVESKRRTVAR